MNQPNGKVKVLFQKQILKVSEILKKNLEKILERQKKPKNFNFLKNLEVLKTLKNAYK